MNIDFVAISKNEKKLRKILSFMTDYNDSKDLNQLEVSLYRTEKFYIIEWSNGVYEWCDRKYKYEEYLDKQFPNDNFMFGKTVHGRFIQKECLNDFVFDSGDPIGISLYGVFYYRKNHKQNVWQIEKQGEHVEKLYHGVVNSSVCYTCNSINKLGEIDRTKLFIDLALGKEKIRKNRSKQNRYYYNILGWKIIEATREKKIKCYGFREKIIGKGIVENYEEYDFKDVFSFLKSEIKYKRFSNSRKKKRTFILLQDLCHFLGSTLEAQGIILS